MSAKQFLPDFQFHSLRNGTVLLNVATAGAGPPVILLHGHPQTMIVWRHVAPRLVAEGFQVILMDLRGYGDSDAPESSPDYSTYSKRTMALDVVFVMDRLDIPCADVVAHDRGARAAHRLARDHPQRIKSLCLMDIAPTAAMYQQTSSEFARRYFWWFFLIQPAPFPEHMIKHSPELFLRRHITSQLRDPTKVSEDVILEYKRCYTRPGVIDAICADYRAAASIDLEHDAQIAEPLSHPILALWGAHGAVGQLFDVLGEWRKVATNVSGAALDCGHALPEEAPEDVLASLLPFLHRA